MAQKQITTKRGSLTGGQLVTRMQTLDFTFMGMLLPNPDPILKAAGKDIKAYRDLSRDSHVGACIRRRKSAVKALQWGLDRGQAPSRVHKAMVDMLAGLDMDRFISNALDAPQFGYTPMEIDWRGGTGGTWAQDLVALPPEWFCFDAENNLRFKSRIAPIYGELLPDKKFLLPRQDATYANPYGQGDLALCWWPVIFMKGGKKFWLNFAEKYGGTFMVGKLPRGAPEDERAELLAAMEDMIQNAVAVIPDDGSVAPLESDGKTASSDLYEKLVLHCRGEISIAQLGTNQTVEQDAGKASAYAGMDVADDLRDGDAEIVSAAANQLIRWAVDINYPGSLAPTFSMWDQKAKDQMQAERDKSLKDTGANFSRSYFVRAYGLQESDLVDSAPVPGAPGAPGAAALPPGTAAAGRNAAAFAQLAFAQGAEGEAPDPVGPEVDQLASAAAPHFADLVAQVQALVDAAPDLATLQRTLASAYGGLDTAALVKLMAAAYALAELKGMAAARDDAGDA